MELSALVAGGRMPPLPCIVQVAEESFEVLEWLRVLPGQRYVAKAQWQGQLVLVKLFVGTKAQRHYARERAGALLLAAQQLPSPTLLAQGFSSVQGGWLVFAYLSDAHSLGQAWSSVADYPLLTSAQTTILAEALRTIARLHLKGLWQADLHLDNLLLVKEVCYVVDADTVQVEHPGLPLSQAKVVENLGVFFAQLPQESLFFLDELLVHYLLVNGAHAFSVQALHQAIGRARRWRMRDYLKKARRECSLFCARISAFGCLVVRRDVHRVLTPVLGALDQKMTQGHIYKTGGAATVVRIDTPMPLVIKRYNIKSFLHWCKRFWRPSRAWHSWLLGQRFTLLGIPTPRPLAVCEERFCGLRGRAFLLTEYRAGADAIALLSPYLASATLHSLPEVYLNSLIRMFAMLIQARISHGDCKGHNLLWDDIHQRWVFIDLDAARWHRTQWGFKRAYARDRARFLNNWPSDSALYRLLDQQLPLVPGRSS